MRIKSLLLTFGILGSSTAALADHNFNSARSDRWGRRVETTVRYRPTTTYQPTYQPAYRQATTWQPLTRLERLDRGGDVFDLSSRERFTQLRLQNQSGRTLVRQIDIVYANGERQCVQVNQALEGNHAMINVDLDGDGRRIDKIFIDGRSARDASYQLYAM